MVARRVGVEPRTFFLNERHELASREKEGGGRLPQYVNIEWQAKARRISRSIDSVVRSVRQSSDPLKAERYFVLARPVAELEKRSTDVRRAPEGTFLDPTSYGSTHGRVFDRLGLDLLHVSSDGRAIIHGTPERIDQLLERSRELDQLGPREQSRWATIDLFDTVPVDLRVDG